MVRGAVGAAAVAALAGAAGAQSVRAVRMGTFNFQNTPVLVTQPAGETSRLWVVEQRGFIRLMDAATGAVDPTPFLSMTGVRWGGEGGLLGMAFHPQYASNGYFYLYYNRAGATSAQDARVIVRYRRDAGNPGIADPASAAVVWAYTASTLNHNGGWLAFGPDGKLYIAWGEHGTGTNAQDITDNPLGKILRIDVEGPDGVVGTADDDQFPGDDARNYAVPADNPFVGVEGDDEIWAYGLRNPWRNSFDRVTGELYIADVGSSTWEEVDVSPAPPLGGGRNYGWNCREGFYCAGSQTNTTCTCTTVSMTQPVYAYLSMGDNGCAIQGGYVYRGCAMPWLNGRYIFGDYCSAKVWSAAYDGTGLVDVRDISGEVWGTITGGLVYSFGEDSSGEIYICRGPAVYKLVPAGAAGQCGCGSADFNGDGDVGTDQDIEAFFGCLGGNCTGDEDADFNGDGDVGTDQDIEAFFRVLGGGWC